MQAVHPPREDPSEPWRCVYFMGLRPRPAPVVPGQKKASVNLNVPVAEFQHQARPAPSWLFFSVQAGERDVTG